MNTQGGSLFIGLEDDGHPIGIELDGLENEDKFTLHITNHIMTRIGKRFMPYSQFTFDQIVGKTVCKISVSSSMEPAFLNERKLLEKWSAKAFFIRGASSSKLDGYETKIYLSKRFPTYTPAETKS
jgi:predicted HTH transcriptional regulator